MSVPVSSTEQPTSSANVRRVVVDGQRQPRYLARAAAELEQAILQVAANVGVTSEDMPGLHGLGVEAARRAERHDR